jgi:hypothetical protein
MLDLYLKRAVMLHVLLVVKGALPDWCLLLFLALLLCQVNWRLLVWVHEVTAEMSDRDRLDKHRLGWSQKAAAGNSSGKQL